MSTDALGAAKTTLTALSTILGSSPIPGLNAIPDVVLQIITIAEVGMIPFSATQSKPHVQL